MIMNQDAAQIAFQASQLYQQGVNLIGETSMTVLALSFSIAIYAIIVGTFYIKLSKKVLYKIKTDKPHKFLRAYFDMLIFLLKYTILFPLFSFVWFVFLSVMLYLMSTKLPLETAFILSISIVTAIRICAYYDEQVSVDLGKLLPLALLGIVLIDASSFTPAIVETKALELLTSLPRFVPFLIVGIAVEWILRLLLGIKRFFIPAKNNDLN